MSIAGKYEFLKQEGFDAYLKALAVPEEKIQAVLNSPNKPITEVTVAGDSVTIKRTGGLGKDHEVTFTLGTEYGEELYGHNVKAVTVKEGDNILKTIAKSERGQSEVVSEFTPDELIVTFKEGKTGASGKRIHKRLL